MSIIQSGNLFEEEEEKGEHDMSEVCERITFAYVNMRAILHNVRPAMDSHQRVISFKISTVLKITTKISQQNRVEKEGDSETDRMEVDSLVVCALLSCLVRNIFNLISK